MPGQLRSKLAVRFGIGTLLFVTLCVAGYFGGYHAGFNRGEQERQAVAFTLRTYPVGDLLAEADPAASHKVRTKAFDDLIDLIVSTVEHESWMANGAGAGEIQPFPTNRTLVISQSGRVHDQIADLLHRLRKLRTDVAVTETIPLLQSLASTEREQSVTLRGFSAVQATGDLELLFDAAVENVAEVWGDPDFQGAAVDRDFPSWSTAQHMACWPRGKGVAYIAVTDVAELGRVLQAGWRAGD